MMLLTRVIPKEKDSKTALKNRKVKPNKQKVYVKIDRLYRYPEKERKPIYWKKNNFYIFCPASCCCVQLCHRVVDGLCGQQPPSRAEYSSTWTLEEWTELNKSLITLFHLAAHSNSCDEKVSES